MSQGTNCNCPCPTPETINIPGAPGIDASAVSPGTVDPEGNVVGTPGQTYFRTDTLTFWVKASGTGNTGWAQLIAAAAVFILVLMFCFATIGAPIYQTYYTTNNTTNVDTRVLNLAGGKIAADVTKQPANNNLTNLSGVNRLTIITNDNAVNLTNLQYTALNGGYTGIITNWGSGFLFTNRMYFTNGTLRSISIP